MFFRYTKHGVTQLQSLHLEMEARKSEMYGQLGLHSKLEASSGEKNSSGKKQKQC